MRVITYPFLEMKRAISGSESFSGALPFLEEALQKGSVTVGQSYEVVEVSESRKRTGYLIKTKLFLIFLFKSSSMVDALIETMEEMVNMNPSYSIWVTVNDDTVEGFSMYVDEDIFTLWQYSKKLRVLDAWTAKSLTKPATSLPRNQKKA